MYIPYKRLGVASGVYLKIKIEILDKKLEFGRRYKHHSDMYKNITRSAILRQWEGGG